ncbi:MAG: CoA ester lyase [Acetobacteraceae bacterium]|nr:CoA ester lyase [Acetobacteraceae bacterium]
MAAPRRPFRAMLYVPANVPRFVEKSAAAGADAVVLDLEDSVPAAEKAAARDRLAASIAAAGAQGAAVLVRVNRPLDQAVPDILAAARGGADGILLAKTLGPEHVVLAAELLRGAPRPMAIIPVIETAAALLKVEAVAAAHPSVAGLLIGGEDLATDLSADPEDEILVLAKRRMAIAAAAAGVFAYGTLGTVADYRDAEHVRRVAEAAKRSGFAGATCIHPSLVPVLRAAFSPTEAELGWARRVLAAAEAAAASGRGSLTVDGRMVDEPVVERARRVLAASGLVTEPSSD